MTVEEYLGQAKWLNEKIDFDLREKTNLRRMAESISAPWPDMERVQTSPRGEANYAPLIDKIRDLELEIDSEVDRLVDLRRQVRDVISSLQDNELEMILKYYYLGCMGWEEIGGKMRMDRSTAMRKHDKAVERIILPVNAIEIRKFSS